ncbi:hypothetical protein C8D78_1134 [Arthrobacter oryzae]|uniref:Uncharacterized protein n=2 Tax=Arthrobacter oryzae TaxID=409290 RepID=A0A495EU34_9MICC|nr:hypothetical protein C8D78_1134 [Arthrobacter oryzae]
MPQESIDLGRIYTAQWTRRDGGLYALLPDADDTFRNAPITGDRVQIRLSELHLADEARLAARQLAGAST